MEYSNGTPGSGGDFPTGNKNMLLKKSSKKSLFTKRGKRGNPQVGEGIKEKKKERGERVSRPRRHMAA